MMAIKLDVAFLSKVVVVFAAALFVGLVALVYAPDSRMDGFCSIQPILNEEALRADRVVFDWLGGTGTVANRRFVSVPGYQAGQGARIEEMRVGRVTVGAIANSALGSGRAWTIASTQNEVLVDYGDQVPTELLHLAQGDRDKLLLFEPSSTPTSCEFQTWLSHQINRSGDTLDIGREDDRVPMQIHNELEVSAAEAVSRLNNSSTSRKCITARWVPRDALPLRAFRGYETRWNGLFNYWLSPHLITRENQPIYFSLGVVRTTAVLDVLGIEMPDPLERTCCVSSLGRGGCSRFGGPDPYLYAIRMGHAASRTVHHQ